MLKDEEDKVPKLNKAWYGLKQAPRAWNIRTYDFLKQNSYSKCTVEHGIYVEGTNQNNINIICLYVDDLLITRNNLDEV